jgi:hypothetical protein
MMTDLYLIQLHGGPFDGYHQSVNYILLDPRFAMPGTLPCPDGFSPSRPAIYELRRSSIELFDGLPTIVLNYHFVGMRVGIAQAAVTSLVQWKDRLTHGLLRAIRGPSDARRAAPGRHGKAMAVANPSSAVKQKQEPLG